MTVTKAYTVDHGVIDIDHAPPMLSPDDSRAQVFLIGNLCNHAHSDRGKFHGQATEVALMNAVIAVGLSDQRKVSLDNSLHTEWVLTDSESIRSFSLGIQRSRSAQRPSLNR